MTLNLSSLENALTQLEQVVARSQDEAFMAAQDDITRNAIRAGVIQHFEFVYELCWKFIQRWLRLNVSPAQADFPRTRKELFRLAAAYSLIQDPRAWFTYGDARNLTAHTYNERDAEIVYQQAAPLAHDARYLLERLKETND